MLSGIFEPKLILILLKYQAFREKLFKYCISFYFLSVLYWFKMFWGL